MSVMGWAESADEYSISCWHHATPGLKWKACLEQIVMGLEVHIVHIVKWEASCSSCHLQFLGLGFFSCMIVHTYLCIIFIFVRVLSLTLHLLVSLQNSMSFKCPYFWRFLTNLHLHRFALWSHLIYHSTKDISFLLLESWEQYIYVRIWAT